MCFIHLDQKHLYFFLVLGKENSSFFFFQLQKKKKSFSFCSVLLFLKRHTHHGGFQKYFIRFAKVPEYTAIVGPRKNEREVAKITALSTGKNRKITSANSEKENQERQDEFQKQVLELTSHSRPIENEFSFSQNIIWNVTENLSYFSEEDVIFASYFRRYEELYTADCANRSDSKKVFLLRKLGATKHTKFINYILPRKASKLIFAEAVELLFSPKISFFS